MNLRRPKTARALVLNFLEHARMRMRSFACFKNPVNFDPRQEYHLTFVNQTYRVPHLIIHLLPSKCSLYRCLPSFLSMFINPNPNRLFFVLLTMSRAIHFIYVITVLKISHVWVFRYNRITTTTLWPAGKRNCIKTYKLKLSFFLFFKKLSKNRKVRLDWVW